MTSELIQEVGETAVLSPNNHEPPLLSVQDLHVWYELKRWGFAHAGYVKAVDGVSFDL
jgi:peptide/nickel transport system ATP-binding protein